MAREYVSGFLKIAPNANFIPVIARFAALKNRENSPFLNLVIHTIHAILWEN